MRSTCFSCVLLSLAIQSSAVAATPMTIRLDTPQAPPEWALLERELIRANEAACREFFQKYFDERGYLLCVERWGGDDGPDDAIENLNDWPLLHALGASDDVLAMIHKAWEGHLRQYTLAKTKEVPFAREGMYYQEFPVMFDWLHNGEGLTVFNLLGLCDAEHRATRERARRFANFYLGDKTGNGSVGNYDPKHRIIRSMFNGSRGPLLRPATAVDWAGDSIEIAGRFRPGHGERNYDEMLAHFKDYQDIVGDHPLNLLATSLALNAYAFTGDSRYRDWLLEYVDAWRQRMVDNSFLIPTKIGLDGRVGGPSGKWYSGVYGWNFSVEVPQTKAIAHRNCHHQAFTGFSNAYLLTGDDRWLDPWRKQMDKINAAAKEIDGRVLYPHMFGPQGWYHFRPERYDHNAAELYYLSLRDDDRARLFPPPRDVKSPAREVKPAAAAPKKASGPAEQYSPVRDEVKLARMAGWLEFLAGKQPDFPARILRADFERVRKRVADLRADTTTPDTRLADDPLHINPCSVGSLIHLMLGGIHPGHQGAPLHCAVRYFDPRRRRAGLPPDVGAIVEGLSPETLVVRLVNLSQTEERHVTLQAGAYGEHQFLSVNDGRKSTGVAANVLQVRLAPGSGGRLVLTWKRHANPPTLGERW